jgi:hypothetical protein
MDTPNDDLRMVRRQCLGWQQLRTALAASSRQMGEPGFTQGRAEAGSR